MRNSVEEIAPLISEWGLVGSDQARLDGLKKGETPWISGGEARIYRRSLYVREGMLHFIAAVGGKKNLYLVSEAFLPSGFTGTSERIGGITIREAELTVENAGRLHQAFPFTAPVSLRSRWTTIGCGDRLGLATPGHVRAAAEYDVTPVLAQQSMRELTLTGRDYPGVVRDATFLVFQEGYERGYGADGDHLKTIKDIDTALQAGIPMITLDLTEVMSPHPASWSRAKVEEEFEALDPDVKRHILEKYAGKTFALPGSTIVFDPTEAKRCALMYRRALDFSREVDRHLKEKRGEAYDLEISIDETTAPTLPSHHLFIADELLLRGVAVNSLAPRFIGEFQKGIDYIGDVKEFETQFAVHCDIARAYGYKISIHSGSDKFSVYPAIGRHTGMKLHLKTAGTSWLEAVRVIARHDPALFRKMLAKAFICFEDATKLYHVTTDLAAIPDARELEDSELERYLEMNDSRQLLHITYGGLLSDPGIRDDFFRTLAREEEEHYDIVKTHLKKHIRVLGVAEPPTAGN
jgi:hypothetical protein